MSNHFCPYCGAPVAGPNAHFCANCGKALSSGINNIPQMKKEAINISLEGKEQTSAGTEAVSMESEEKPVVDSHFPDIAPEGAEQQGSTPVIKEQTGLQPKLEVSGRSSSQQNKDDGFSDSSFSGMYFSFNGRLNRARYFWRLLVVAGIYIALTVGSTIIVHLDDAIGGLGFLGVPVGLAMVAAGFGVMIAVISLQIRRMQDMGWKPGVVYSYVSVSILWGLAAPFILASVLSDPFSGPSPILSFINLFFLGVNLALWFKKGDKGPNAYGPDPLEDK